LGFLELFGYIWLLNKTRGLNESNSSSDKSALNKKFDYYKL